MLRISEVSHFFSRQKVLENVSLSLQKGETVAILGPSGCGKSTLLNVVLGRIRTPSAGTVSVDSVVLNGKSPKERGIAMVRQRPSRFRQFSVLQNISLGALYGGAAKEETESRARHYAGMLKIEHLLDVRHPLSGGEYQRVALARALATGANILLFDEPLNSLDVILAREFRPEIRELLHSQQITALWVTHNPIEAFVMGDRVAIMNEGQIVEEGTLETLRASADPLVERFVRAGPEERTFTGKQHEPRR